MSKATPILDLQQVSKTYAQGNHALCVLDKASLQIHPREIVGLIGSSGSGKSTLLHLAGLLDDPTSGKVILEGTDVTGQSEQTLTQWRNQSIGFVYQFHHLLPEFTALENVMLPQLIHGVSQKEAKAAAEGQLESLGLGDRMHHHPSELSGGEQQRVAIARAFANNPKLILADEPTGNLDPETAHRVFELFLERVRRQKVACLIVTHDHDLIKKMDRVFSLKSGVIKAL